MQKLFRFKNCSDSNETDFEWNRLNETDLEFEQFSYLNRFSNFKFSKFEKETKTKKLKCKRN
jgi:hypothetical protein